MRSIRFTKIDNLMTVREIIVMMKIPLRPTKVTGVSTKKGIGSERRN